MVVVHRPPHEVTHLPAILGRCSRLPVAVPVAGEMPRHGVCYVGVPNQHLTVGPGLHFDMVEDGFYRAHNIDALFASLAQHAGPRTIGVVLPACKRTAFWA
jgi:chemotaxis response regulator CheB